MKRATWMILAGAAVLAAPMFGGNYARYIATLWLIFGISAIGLQIPVGLAQVYSFGHGVFMLIGAYTAGVLLLRGVPLAVVLCVAPLLAAAIGALLALPSLRLSSFGLAIVSMGAAALFFQGVKAFPLLGGPQGLALPQDTLAKSMDGRLLYALVFAIGVLALVVSLAIARGRLGRALRAAAANPIMAQSFGIHLLTIRTVAFVVSAAYGAIAGALLAVLTGYVAPDAFSPELSIQMFAAVMIGGSGSPWGPLLGALFIVMIPELTQSVQNAGAIIYSVLFTLTAVVYPQGLAALLSALQAGLRSLWRRQGAGHGAA